MRQLPAIMAVAAFFLAVRPGTADAQGMLDPRRAAKSMVDASLGYALLSGEVGDSLKAGPTIEASYQYQLGSVPVRVGAGAAYSRHGLEEFTEGVAVSGHSNKWSAFALGSILLFGEDTDMIPYVQARLGYTKFYTKAEGVDSNRGGLELGALVGVDLPVSENISIDVSGLFAWINTGNASVDGVTYANTSGSGSQFSLRGGAFFYF